jgi:hypothetical protein
LSALFSPLRNHYGVDAVAGSECHLSGERRSEDARQSMLSCVKE